MSIDGIVNAPRSINNRFILEPYVNKGGLKSTIQHGIATPEQKVTLVGLKVLMGVKLSDGTAIPKGSTAFIQEKHLHTMPWAKAILSCPAIEGQFIIVDQSNVEFVVPDTEDIPF